VTALLQRYKQLRLEVGRYNAGLESVMAGGGSQQQQQQQAAAAEVAAGGGGYGDTAGSRDQ
jgi:hypothetical protein